MSLDKKKKDKKPWPTKAAMEQVYECNLWGGNQDFFSGEGSHLPEIVNPYVEAVLSFLNTFKSPLRICDLGCGDFNIGKQLVAASKEYIAVDIVRPLIERNKSLFTANNLSFLCLDIAQDNLPQVDCVIIRQVLQHLSNEEVKKLVDKLANYKYLILTEHIPNGDFEPNKDIISGQGIRIKKKSGLNLLAAPFHLKVENQKVLCEFEMPNNKGRIQTLLYQLL